MTTALPLSIALFSLLACACKVPPPPKFEVAIKVESDPGEPLAGARVSSSGAPLGTSDTSGALQLALVGTAGEVVALDVACPDGHRRAGEALSVALRQVAQDGRRPEFRVRCLPLTRSLVLAVRATHGANMPVRYLGREIARTDASGTAHALLRVAPGETVTVSLDSSGSEHAELIPTSAQRTITMPSRDELVLFDQVFNKPVTKQHRRRKVEEPVGPIRI